MKFKMKSSALALALVSALSVSAVNVHANVVPIENSLVEQYLTTQNSVTTAALSTTDILVVPVPEGASVTLPEWSEETTSAVQRILEIAEFTGKAGQQQIIIAPHGLETQRLVLVGVGEPSEYARKEAEKAGAALAATVNSTTAETVGVDGRLITNPVYNGRILAAMSHGADLRNYRFDRYFSEPTERPAQRYTWRVASQSQANQEFAELQAVAEGVFLARELTNLPGSAGYPAAFAEYARQALEPAGVEVTILTPDQVQAMGMGALYGVSQGSQHKAHLLVAHWRGSDDQPLAMVGKGNTFDTGGYNLKTSSGTILRMQTDKAGAAAVMGSVLALARQNAAVNVVAVAPLAHNLVSHEALLPGDVVTTGSGLTIEVANTDAEGRLILADGLWYARENYQPRAMVDIATLTGSKIGAVGNEYAAVFSDHSEVLAAMQSASDIVEERIWRLPMDPMFAPAIESRIADMKNVGSPGATAGAMLLQRFVGDTPWLHIDMAGNAMVDGATGIHPAGATGFGVRLLTEWAKRQP
ncbi:MAG: extracytoplasmic leucyl aminopeptidase [Idiomarinaceae bacterium HL-53]|nr:MAG: extracytoplasmic leucyl aminopeptidase [Idiomarinaceae bacterium HL-53]CUS47707.1 leucyl aminopeptidase [Idiomarinaceae bacterium HL-53]